jgi:hypothetical protein
MIPETSLVQRLHSSRFLVYLAGLGLTLLLVRCEPTASSSTSTVHVSNAARQGTPQHTSGEAK